LKHVEGSNDLSDISKKLMMSKRKRERERERERERGKAKRKLNNDAKCRELKIA
jgi:hypothetical protein